MSVAQSYSTRMLHYFHNRCTYHHSITVILLVSLPETTQFTYAENTVGQGTAFAFVFGKFSLVEKIDVFKNSISLIF